MAEVMPDSPLPEREKENLTTVFDILTKNGWRFNRYDRKWFFKFRKTGFQTYKDRYIFLKLLRKYSGQLDRVLKNMGDEDRKKLEKAEFSLLVAEASGKRREVKIDWDRYYKKLHEGQPWMKDRPYDKEFIQRYNEFTLFKRDPNDEFERQVLRYEGIMLSEFGEIPERVKPAYYNFRKALYELMAEHGVGREVVMFARKEA